MTTEDIIRAWKDADFRSCLSAEERAYLPEHPAGDSELVDAELEQVAGGMRRSGGAICTCDIHCPQSMNCYTSALDTRCYMCG